MSNKNHFLNISFSGTREQIENALYDKGMRDEFLSLFLIKPECRLSIGQTEYGCGYEAELFSNSQLMFLNDLVRERIETYLRESSLEEIIEDRKKVLDSSDEPC